jgi:hypothetical protein
VSAVTICCSRRYRASSLVKAEITARSTQSGFGHSADQDGMRLTICHSEWKEFAAGVKNGDFDGL